MMDVKTQNLLVVVKYNICSTATVQKYLILGHDGTGWQW